MNHPIMFLAQDNRTKLVSASFSYFLEVLSEKNKNLVYKKCESCNRYNLPVLHKKLINLFYLRCSCKKVVEN